MTTATVSAIAFDRPADRKDLYAAKAGRVRFLDVPPARFFMVEGTGQPGGDEFREAFGALYPMAYTLHFAVKKRGVTAPVGGLEGLYWLGEPGPLAAELFAAPPDPARPWTWCLMLPVPEEATDDEIAGSRAEVERKKAPPALGRLRIETLLEGPSAQILHVGPYDAEAATVATLHEAIAAAGLRPRARHHEVYLSDPNRTAPERIKTIIRQPVEPAG
jgi:hypothetical protein